MFNIEKSYWNNNGKFQREYNELSKLTPNIGWSNDDDIYIDLLTSISNIYYRYYNDGDKEINTYLQEKLIEGLNHYREEILPLLEDKKHFINNTDYIFNINIKDKESLEDLVNAVIQLGIKEKLNK